MPLSMLPSLPCRPHRPNSDGPDIKHYHRKVTSLISIGNPDILHLHRMAEQDRTLARRPVVPIERQAVVDQRALEIADRQPFRRRRGGLGAERPERVDIVVL